MTSIPEERAALAVVGMRLRRREEWDARRSYIDARPVTEPAAYQFVHITITNPASYSSDDAHARAVENIGINRFPNTGISYNRLLFQSGGAYEGQPIGRRGAHTVNDDQRSTCGTAGCPSRGGSVAAPSFNLNLNARSYAICQNVADVVTAKQLDSLAKIMAADRLAGFVRRNAGIHGHRCVSSKSCPGDRMWALMAELEQKVNNYVANGLLPTPEPPPQPEDDDMEYVTQYGATQYRLVADKVYALSEPTFRILRDGGVPVKTRSNAAVEALTLILNGEDQAEDLAVQAVEDKVDQLVAAHAEEPTPTP